MNLFYGIALSLHLGLEGNYNPVHPNLGVEHNNFSAGAYYNSESNISPYISYDFEISNSVNLQFGAVGGYTTGAVLPMAKLNYNRFFVTPAYEDYSGKKIGIVLGIEQRF